MTRAPALPTAPAITWIGDDTEPSDEFLDALVRVLADVVDRRRIAEQAERAGDEEHGGQDE